MRAVKLAFNPPGMLLVGPPYLCECPGLIGVKDAAVLCRIQGNEGEEGGGGIVDFPALRVWLKQRWVGRPGAAAGSCRPRAINAASFQILSRFSQQGLHSQ